MRNSLAVIAIILALIVGYAAGYFTYLFRFSTPVQRAAVRGELVEKKPPVFVHPMVAEIEKARKLNAAGKKTEAKKILSDDLKIYPQAPEGRDARELLGAINTELFFGRDDLFGKTSYTVERGDSLGRIAQKLNSSPEMIMRANSLDSAMIHPGDKLVVPDGDFTLTIDLGKKRVVVHHGDGFFKQYPIRSIDLPRSSQTRITTKVTAATFWKDGQRVLPTAENVEAATPWVQFAHSGYVLYGVSEEDGVEPDVVEITEAAPATAAKPEPEPEPEPDPDVPPRGIALLKDDLAEMQLLLSRGTPVTILRERK